MVEYRIFFSQSAERDLKKLPKDVRKRIMLVLSRARFDLKRYVKKLRDTSFFG